MRQVMLWFAVGVPLSCETSPEPIEGSDSRVFQPRVEVALPLDNSERPLLLVADYTRSEGDFRQVVPAGEFVELDERAFAGPLTVAFAHEVEEARLMIRIPFGGEQFAALLQAGLVFDSLDLEGVGGATFAEDRFETVNAGIGVDLVTPIAGSVDLHLRPFAAMPAVADSANLVSVEAGLSVDLGASLLLEAGWRFWDYSYVGSRDDSDVDIRQTGPYVLFSWTATRSARTP